MSASLYFKKSNQEKFLDVRDEENNEMDLNMSNSNARLFLSTVGLDTDFENVTYKLDSFFSALMAFLNSNRAGDEGRETVTHFGVVGQSSTMIDCGVRGGYVGERAAYALDMCKAARSLGADECYFC